MELKDTIIGKIAHDALTNPEWDNLSEEEAKKKIKKIGNPKNITEQITFGSEEAAVRGIATILGLSDKHIEQLLGDDKNGEIYTSDKISKNVSTRIEDIFDENKFIVDVLSVIHDEWVKNNEENFMKEGRNKEYQFVPLMLLSWEDVKSDLIFLKPIIEATGKKVNEESIKEYFEKEQEKYLLNNGIDTREDLKEFIQRGEEFYPALKGLETKNGGDIIRQIRRKDDIASRMANQIFDRNIPRYISQKATLEEKLKEEENEYGIVRFIANNEMVDLDCGVHASNYYYDESEIIKEVAMSKKAYELMLNSGKFDRAPGGRKHVKECTRIISTRYSTEFVPFDELNNEEKAKVYIAQAKLAEAKAEYEKNPRDSKYYVRGRAGNLSVTQEELLENGVLPSEVGWKSESKTISSKDIAQADKETGLTTQEMGGVKKIFYKLRNLFRGDNGKDAK